VTAYDDMYLGGLVSMPHRLKKIFARIESYEKEMVKVLCECVRKKALGPLNGGHGEAEKADYLQDAIKDFGFDSIRRIDVPDDSVPSGHRPNIVATMKGRSDRRTLWLIGHMDVVPAGDLNLWQTDPFEPVVKDGRVYGRGSEDNGQDMVASLFAARALRAEGMEPEYNVACMMAADEETGSEFGIKHIMKDRPDMFGKGDLVMVPDAPTPEGERIEVAEKSILWLKVTTIGMQCHGSTPEKGINAHKAAAKYITDVDKVLYSRFQKKDELFSPPVSTFEVTKKVDNVPSVNIIPGEDVVYFDNRVLPAYPVDDVMSVYEEVARNVEAEKGVRFKFEIAQQDDAAPPTKKTDDISKLTAKCVRMVYENQPYFGGIGGGTYAAMFRRSGIPAVVWGKGDEIAHQPNEYCVICNMVGDAKVFSAMAMTNCDDLK
jgi:succinyl-diaminopimelate desuccinylase